MRLGDFTTLAQDYAHRPAYATHAIAALRTLALAERRDVRVADIGAGTGKLTAMLDGLGLEGVAVEPNDAMRAEGERLDLAGFHWRAGTAEDTGLEDESLDWLTMASAFHWADDEAALREFHRVLKPGAALTLLWNPRDLENDRLQARIEARIAALAPNIRRRSSGGARYTHGLEAVLTREGLFANVLHVEALHIERMSRARHLGAWRSVNDIRAQAGEALFDQILDAIDEELGDAQTVEVRYRTRAWIAWRTP